LSSKKRGGRAYIRDLFLRVFISVFFIYGLYTVRRGHYGTNMSTLSLTPTLSEGDCFSVSTLVYIDCMKEKKSKEQMSLWKSKDRSQSTGAFLWYETSSKSSQLNLVHKNSIAYT